MLYVFGRQFRRTKRINVFKFKESKSHHTPDITIRERNQNEVHNSVSNFADKTLTLRLEMINNIMRNYRFYKLTHQWIGWIRDVDICFSLKDIYHYIHVTLWNLKIKTKIVFNRVIVNKVLLRQFAINYLTMPKHFIL